MSTFATQWTSRLTGGFPLLAAMQVRVVGDDAAWHLTAPFAPNRNDHATAFGGSLSTLATITGWMVTCIAAGATFDVVIQQGSADFIAPLTEDLLTHPLPLAPDVLQRFQQTLQKRGKARLVVQVEMLNAAGQVVLCFAGQYVAVKR